MTGPPTSGSVSGMMLDRFLMVALVALLALLIGERAGAQTPPTATQGPSDAAKAMVGGWELSNADRDKTCTMSFKLGPNAATYPIELEKKCGEAFPPTRAIVAWTFGKNDMLLLIDNTGKAV